MTIIEFLRARYAEEATGVPAASPALRDIESKLRIVDECERACRPRRSRRGYRPTDAQVIALADAVLAALAMPYEAHADYLVAKQAPKSATEE